MAPLLSTDSYSYDSGGRVTSESILSSPQQFSSLTYDADNEQTGAIGSLNGTPVTMTYNYDSDGNRNSAGYSGGTGNEIATAPGVTYTYDNDGNIISQTSGGGTTTYTYDFRNRLTSVSDQGTILASFTYDALNRRIGTYEGTIQTWTVYDGSNAYADMNGSTPEERYLYGPAVDEVLARTNPGVETTNWYLTDQQGSVNQIADTTGHVVNTIVYDTYGNIASETNPTNGDRFKYAGMQWDSAIGMSFDEARFYNPVTGRFMEQDPLGLSAGDVNVYRYVGNSPTDGVDPSGLKTRRNI